MSIMTLLLGRLKKIAVDTFIRKQTRPRTGFEANSNLLSIRTNSANIPASRTCYKLKHATIIHYIKVKLSLNMMIMNQF